MVRTPWLLVPALLLGACDDYILPEVEVEASRVDTILALTADVTAGEAVFSQHCEVCHDKLGDTPGAGPALRALLPTLTDAEVVETILQGSGTMPAINLEDQATADVAAWLRASFDGDAADTADSDTDAVADTDTDT